MLFSFVFVLMAVVILVQMLLCLKARKLWCRLSLPVLLGLGELACLATYFLSILMEQTGKDVFGMGFAAVIYAVMLAYLAAADAAAWIIWAVIRYIQNRKK